MFTFIFQSLTSLLLLGVLTYAVLTIDRLKGQPLAQHSLLGLFFGLMVISLGMNTMGLDASEAPFDAKAGPLILAGYLGGPSGALIAGLIAALYRTSLGEFMLVIGVLTNITIPWIGVGVRFLCPPDNWPITGKAAIGYLAVGFALLQLILFFHINGVSKYPDTKTLLPLIGFTVSGIVSILITWQILNAAGRFANNANQSVELAKKLDLALSASGMGMFEFVNDGSRILFDSGMVSIYGLDKNALNISAEYPGLVLVPEWEALVFPDDLPAVKEISRQILSGEKLRGRWDFRAVRPDGKLLHIRSTWISELNADHTLKRVISMHSDLTDIHEAEQRHQDSQGRLAVIAQHLPGVFLEFDGISFEKPKLLYISPKCKDIWGYSDDEFLANPLLLVQQDDPDDLNNFLEIIKKSHETGEPMYHRFRITTRDGQSRWLDAYGSFTHENGRVLIKSIVLDATREVEAQKQMEEEHEISRRAQKFESIGQLTGGVAHDFNNLLAVILGNLEILRESDSPPAQKKLINTAIAAVLQGADLTKSMLAFARKASLSPVVLDLNHVVREARNWIGRTIPESVVVETSLLAELWPIEADRSSLESALLNLILNARDTMQGQGNLTIKTANVQIDDTCIGARQEELTPGRYVVLSVSDTGPGISDDIVGSIFEPFFTTKPPGEGSGLGLSMIVGFMKQSGGTINVRSLASEGTTFKLYFPASDAQQKPLGKPLIADRKTEISGKKLLVAEDEKAVRDTLVNILELGGYQVTAAASGDVAFTIYKNNPTFDLLLTDIVMPGRLQGPDLAQALRNISPALPVLYISGYANESTAHGHEQRAEDIRLTKPVQRNVILTAVDHALSLRIEEEALALSIEETQPT